MKQIALTIFFLLGWTAVSHARMVSIAGEVVNLRSGPGNEFEVVWELGRGFPLNVIDQQGEWLKVVDYEDDTGWVQKDQVAEKAYMVVKGQIADIRSGPGENYRIIRRAQPGVVFRTLARKDNWVRVHHEEEGITGWVLRDLMWGW